jgi:hypothetical protein
MPQHFSSSEESQQLQLHSNSVGGIVASLLTHTRYPLSIEGVAYVRQGWLG